MTTGPAAAPHLDAIRPQQRRRYCIQDPDQAAIAALSSAYRGDRKGGSLFSPLNRSKDMTTLVLVVTETDGDKAMRELQLREAKSTLSAVVEAAERGEPTTITKHGRPAAVIISHDEWTKLNSRVPSFADLLLAVPEFTEGDLPERRPARIARKSASD